MAGDQSCIAKEGLGGLVCKVWHGNDQHAANRNLARMEEGVSNTPCLLVLMSGRRERSSMPNPTGTYAPLQWRPRQLCVCARACARVLGGRELHAHIYAQAPAPAVIKLPRLQNARGAYM